MINPEDVSSLTDFQRNTKKHLARLKKTGRAQVLTINGRAAAVVMDPKACQALVEKARRLDEIEALQEGIRDLEAGRAIPADRAFRELRAKYSTARKRRSA